jgi:phosphoglycolate phosphatase
MAVLFDLDGTLTDPGLGIVRSILYALDRMGVPHSGEDLDWCVGPPLAGSFATILGTGEPSTITEAIRLYRERFSEIGLYENRIYPGIVESLKRLREEEIPLLVATSKPHVFARRVLDHFDLNPFFDAVYGSEVDGRLAAKGDLIAVLMLAEGLSPGSTLMVGDREHDVFGARQNGIPCLGVTYGYGSDEELEEAGAAALCDRPERLAESILSLRGMLALGCENRP